MEGISRVQCELLLGFKFLKFWRWQWVKGGEECLARDMVWWGGGHRSQRVNSLTRVGLDHGRMRAQAGTCTVVAAVPLDCGARTKLSKIVRTIGPYDEPNQL